MYIVNDPWAPFVGSTYEIAYAEIVNGRSTGRDTGRWESSIIFK